MVKTGKRPRAADATARKVAEARELFAAVLKAATTARRQQWLHRDTADSLDLLIGMAELGLRSVADEDEDDGADVCTL